MRHVACTKQRSNAAAAHETQSDGDTVQRTSHNEDARANRATDLNAAKNKAIELEQATVCGSTAHPSCSQLPRTWAQGTVRGNAVAAAENRFYAKT